MSFGIQSYAFADGKSLAFALEKELSKAFLELAIMCKAVICCTSLAVLLLHLNSPFIRSSVPVTKGTSSQACQEEPKGHPPRYR